MSEYTGFEIAIIGMAGKFPGASDLQRFWENLRGGVESVEFFSREEILEEGEDAALVDHPSYVKANAFLKDKEFFDAPFFGYLPAEAQLMDPQMRLFHEICWAALEDAGCNPNTPGNKIGLFAGASPNINWEIYARLANEAGLIDDYSAMQLSNARFLATKIAYALNLKGWAMFVDTACSTSLVAVHQACRSLLVGDCTMALAGGVTIHNESKRGYLHQEGMIHSADGHCRTFDAEATGTVAGEGAGAVVLKKLKNALKDGDHIYAIIRGTGINNDGSDKVGYTAPSVDGQMEAIMTAHKWAKLDPATISYVEAHGTGTRLGDPVEMAGLTRAFNTHQKQFCAIGSVKSNIGHLDTAAGIAGLIKTVLSLQHRELVPSLHYKAANPEIDFVNSPFYVNTTLQPWQRNGHPLRAGVSAFGIGGTNVHVVLEEAPVREAGADSRLHQLLLLSGKTIAALERNAMALLRYLQQNLPVALPDIAYTLQQGRESFHHRKMLVCRSREEAIALLSAPNLLSGGGVYSSEKRSVGLAFMFPGQGSQYAKMCEELYEAEGIFRDAVDGCLSIVLQRYQKDLGAVLLGSDDRIDQTEYTQPCLFIVEYALSQLLMHWGLRPATMIGHSIGEYVAACISGIFSLEDALHLVVKRGEWMQSAPAGKMLSVSMPESSLAELLQGKAGLSLASVNGPLSCVVAGAEEAIAVLKTMLEQQGHVCRELRTSHAFHSYMMDEVLEGFRNEFKGIVFNAMQLPFVSNVTGQEAKAEEVCSADYWVRHLRSPVRFADGLANLVAADPQLVLLEVGPGKVLSTLADMQGQEAIATMRGAKETGLDSYYLTNSLGHLWERGVAINWADYYGAERRLKVSLPGYSFEQLKFPVHVNAYKMIQEQLGSARAVAQRTMSDWFYTPVWKQSFLAGERSADSTYSNAGSKKILIFAAVDGPGAALASRLRTAGHELTEVYEGISFQHQSEQVYILHPQQEEGYALLAASLVASGREPVQIIHMWSAGSCYSLADTVKTWFRHCRELVLISEDAQLVRGDEGANPSRIMGQGLLKVIGQEYPGIVTAHIDISWLGSHQETVISQLIRELDNLSKGAAVSYRQGQRWIEQYDPVKIGTAAPAFRQNGVYLITGGLGNLGYTLSKYLLQQYNARLILVGRTAHLEGDKLRRYDALNSLGRIRYIACDIADPAALAAAIGSSEIHGVIHAAGVVEGRSIGLIRELRKEDYEVQFTAKINGLQSLAAVLQTRQPDFCIATSSLSTVLGGLGFGAYAAANKYMDQFIKRGTATGVLRNWVSVSLDGLDYDSSSSEQEITAPEICEVLERVLSHEGLAHIIVSKTDLPHRLERWVTGSIHTEEAAWSPAAEAAPATQDEVQTQLQLLWEGFFGQAGIATTADFFSIGGDSLKALTMLSRIHKLFAVDVSIRDFYDHATIAAQSALIFSRLDTAVVNRTVSIPVAAAAELYPLSSAQRRMYFLHAFDKQALTYNMSHVIRMEGALDVDRIRRSFEQLIHRHEILRTHFELSEGTVMQRVSDAGSGFEMAYYETDEAGIATIANDFVRPFDLGQAPLLRVGLIRIDAQTHVLLMDMHHVVTDGVSTNILAEDLMRLYHDQALPALRIQYKDYAQWQQSKSEQQRIAAQQDFWKAQYKTLPEPLNLPADYIRPAIKSTAGAVLMRELSPEITAGLRQLAEREKVSMFMLLLSLYYILLHKLSNQEDIVIATPTAGRLHADLEGVMGMFVNTLPLRNRSEGKWSFRSFLQQVKHNTLSCFDNQEYQYEDMIEALNVSRDMSRNPLFDAMFSYENFEDPDLELQGLKLTPYERNYTVSKFDITLIASEGEDRVYTNFEYSTALFREETIARMVLYFNRIAAAVTANADISLKDITVLDQAARTQILEGFNATSVAYTADKSLMALFDEAALQSPVNIALKFGNEQMSYGALKELSDGIALYLQEQQGIKKGDLVGVVTEYNLHFIPLLYGLLKAGAVYVPIDPQHPASRIQAIVSDAGLRLIVKSREQALQMDNAVNVEDIETILAATAANKGQALRYTLHPDDLAYIIYTSGSTGEPKGVMIEHRSLQHIIHALQSRYPLRSTDNYLLKTAFSFDVSIAEIFGWFMEGGSLSILPPADKSDMRKVIAAIRQYKVTHINFVPSVFSAFLDALKNNGAADITSLKYIFLAGEALPEHLVVDFHSLQTGVQLENIYGPTEGTVYSSAYSLKHFREGMKMTIGKPIDNVRLYIFDKHFGVQPLGVPGELCIGGAGLAKGYLNNPALTAEKFIAHPYHPSEKIYRTGDLVRWLEDGNIEYLGRIDDQVKLRGLRIELGEIITRLSAHEAIRQCTVAIKEWSGSQYLVGYYISNELLPVAALREFLKQRLPDYMIPSFFVRLESLPLTSSGKTDKKALPLPEIKAAENDSAPTGDTEEKLVAIWAKALQLAPEVVGVNKNFFELGGNSLKIVSLNQMVNEAFGCSISTADMFGLTTILEMKRFIEQGNEVSAQKIAATVSDTVRDMGAGIAVIGMAGRFPGANDIDSFWENIRGGVESVTFFSREELLAEGEDVSALDDPAYVRANAYVKDKEYFDAGFFGYQSAEVRLMDPQMRLFHEVCWAALENGGYGRRTPQERIGLFASGASNPNWEVYAMLKNEEEGIDNFSASHLRDISFLATKISYKLNLKGPAIFVQSACSSSLVAVHQACSSLLAGDCTMALAGGITIRPASKTGYLHQDGMIHSADGHCRAFDAQATGTVDGEGAGVVVLKRVEDAVRDGDHIYAVIRGTGINNDGNDKVGYTAPSIDGQMKAIRMAHEWAKIDPATIGYVEAHGTGTRLGDPVEIAGLTRAFNTDQKQFCGIGSLKSNIGHLDIAAGVAGLIKTVLSLQHRELAPSLHYREANPEIDFTNSPFYVNTELRAWPRNGHPLRAGVSSFGIGGTNVHVVLEEAPVRETGTDSRPHQLLVLSGKTAGALERNAAKLRTYLQGNPPAALPDIAYTLQIGRESFNYRKTLVCRTREEAIALLGAPSFLSGGGIYSSEKRTVGVAFMFPGQGSQYEKMCQGLYEAEVVFRNVVDQCIAIVSRRYHKDLGAVLFGSDHRIDQTEYTQPCLFIVEYALSQLLMSWGLRPAMMIGHSIGEYVAACISGVFSLEDALHLVVKRGEWMQSAPVGKMLSVSMPESSLAALLQGSKELSLAAVNGPSSCVVSGNAGAITSLKTTLEQQGQICRELRTSHAFHSYMMDEVLEGFRHEFSNIVFNDIQLPFISNVTGEEAKAAAVCSADYWVHHLRAPVRFADGISGLLAAHPQLVLLEVGPGKVLSALAGMAGQEAIATVRGAKETAADSHHLINSLGKLWERGVPVNWADYYKSERRLKVPLPDYSFEPVPFPVHVDAYQLLQEQLGKGSGKAVSQRTLSDWFYMPVWKQSFLTGTHLSKHTNNHKILIFADGDGIGAGLASQWRAAGHEVTEVYRGASFLQRSEHAYELNPEDTAGYVQLSSALVASRHEPARIVHMWSAGAAPDYAGCCYSLSDIVKTWSLHCRELILVSEEGQLVRGEEEGHPLRIMAQGLLKVIGQEYPGISTMHIDISLARSNRETVIRQLIRELDGVVKGSVVSYRQGQRWIEQFDPVKIDAALPVFREGGVYLITGGLGHLGYTLSKYLLKKYNAKLVLLGRTAKLDGDKQRRYEELTSLGLVRYTACDINDPEMLRKAILVSEEQLGSLHGVIHAAGIIEGRSIGLIGELGKEDYEAQFAGKINGLQSLAAVLKNRELDFCVATSSLSTVLGGVGYGAYASANKYMDQLVKQGTANGELRNWLSVGLDGLDFENSRSEQDITGAELCEVLERVLSHKELTHMIVSKTALQERLERWVTGNRQDAPVVATAAKENVTTVATETVLLPGVTPRFLDNPYTAPRNELDTTLADIWKEIFSVDKVGIADNFFALGGHSLNVFQILNRISKLDYQIRFRDMYDYQTIEKLSDYLMKQKQKKYAKPTRQNTPLN